MTEPLVDPALSLSPDDPILGPAPAEEGPEASRAGRPLPCRHGAHRHAAGSDGLNIFGGVTRRGAHHSKGTFWTDGRMLVIAVLRLRLVKGSFQVTSPGCLAGRASTGHLILCLEADLCFSTPDALAATDPTMETIPLLDEFRSPPHENRALGTTGVALQREHRPLAARADRDRLAVEPL